MDHNWGYVAAGYGITTGALLVYGGWLWNRLRRAQQSATDGD
ncbi:MAG: hypothetical protein JWL83_3360 [Actinomycetia bacterium]|nr:hypothetical protein [Actinomycetes bacterium]